MARDDDREVVYVDRGEGSIKPVLFGALLGLAVGLLFAPQSGDETRRVLKRRMRKMRALAEEKAYYSYHPFLPYHSLLPYPNASYW